jgi:hypothetical protein
VGSNVGFDLSDPHIFEQDASNLQSTVLLEIYRKLAFPFLSSNKGTGHFFRRLNFSKSAGKFGIASNSRFKHFRILSF